MTKAIKAAGYIIEYQAIIWGIGATIDAAFDDLEHYMRAAGMGPEEILRSDFRAVPATAGLLADVAARGGNIAWTTAENGVRCTEAEAEDEEAETA